LKEERPDRCASGDIISGACPRWPTAEAASPTSSPGSERMIGIRFHAEPVPDYRLIAAAKKRVLCETAFASSDYQDAAMPVRKACEALQSSRCLELTYEGLQRCVEVHAVGYTADNSAMALVWQKSGFAPEGWQVIRLEGAKHLRVSRDPSEAPRRGYERSRFPFSHLECSV